MTYADLSTINSSKGLQEILVYANTVTNGFFISMALTAFFIIILLATYNSQKNRTGYGDFWASFAVAGFLNFVLAVLFSLISGLMNLYVLIICLALAIIGLIGLMFNRREQ